METGGTRTERTNALVELIVQKGVGIFVGSSVNSLFVEPIEETDAEYLVGQGEIGDSA